MVCIDYKQRIIILMHTAIWKMDLLVILLFFNIK